MLRKNLDSYIFIQCCLINSIMFNTGHFCVHGHTIIWKEGAVGLAHAPGRCRWYTMQQQTESMRKWARHSITRTPPYTPPPTTPALYLPSALLWQMEFAWQLGHLPPQTMALLCRPSVWAKGVLLLYLSHTHADQPGWGQATDSTPPQRMQVPKLMTALRFWHSERLQRAGGRKTH